MLNGLHPVLIFRIKNVRVKGNDFLTKKRGVIDSVLTDYGLPIPIYLHPVTGISVQDDSKAIDLDTEPQTVKDEITQMPKTIFTQKAVNSMTTISLVAQKNSVALSVLFAFSEQIVKLAIDQGYSIDYFNGPILVTGGLLKSISTSANTDNNLLNVNIQLSRGDDSIFEKKYVELKAAVGPKP